MLVYWRLAGSMLSVIIADLTTSTGKMASQYSTPAVAPQAMTMGGDRSRSCTLQAGSGSRQHVQAAGRWRQLCWSWEKGKQAMVAAQNRQGCRVRP